MGTVTYTVIDGEIVSENRNGAQSFYVPDQLGSTVALLDNTQAKTDTFSYWPYGENDGRTGTTPTPFQFVGTRGGYWDSASRVYFRARTLDSVQGRWITLDPIGFAAGDLNLLRFVRNSPISLTDPSGMQSAGQNASNGLSFDESPTYCQIRFGQPLTPDPGAGEDCTKWRDKYHSGSDYWLCYCKCAAGAAQKDKQIEQRLQQCIKSAGTDQQAVERCNLQWLSDVVWIGKQRQQCIDVLCGNDPGDRSGGNDWKTRINKLRKRWGKPLIP